MKARHEFNSDKDYKKYLQTCFAGLAMQGYLANPAEADITPTYVLEKLGFPKETKYVFEEHYPKYVANISVQYADALLQQLNSKP